MSLEVSLLEKLPLPFAILHQRSYCKQQTCDTTGYVLPLFFVPHWATLLTSSSSTKQKQPFRKTSSETWSSCFLVYNIFIWLCETHQISFVVLWRVLYGERTGKFFTGIDLFHFHPLTVQVVWWTGEHKHIHFFMFTWTVKFSNLTRLFFWNLLAQGHKSSDWTQIC